MEENGTGEASDPTQEDVAANGGRMNLHNFGSGTAGTGDSCLHGSGRCGGGSTKKRSRSAPWTVSEMLALIDAKKEERERCAAYKSQGVKLPAAEKWRVVATHMEAKEMGRSGSQCQDKWENMMKDYKAVREWQYLGGAAGKNYFKDMTNKERKDASLPPQMDEVVFYSLHAIQNEKEEKRDKVRWKERNFKQPPVSPVPVKDKVGSSEGNDMESMDTDSSGKRRRRKKVMMQQQQQARVSLENPVVLDDFVHAMKDGSKELIDCFMKVLERSDSRRQEAAAEMEHNKPKDTATLARVLVALADAVKTVAQKL